VIVEDVPVDNLCPDCQDAVNPDLRSMLVAYRPVWPGSPENPTRVSPQPGVSRDLRAIRVAFQVAL
jgi:hypothetical protein